MTDVQPRTSPSPARPGTVVVPSYRPRQVLAVWAAAALPMAAAAWLVAPLVARGSSGDARLGGPLARSAVVGIVVHSTQTVFVSVAVLGVVR